jgi:hypothetical protein
MGDRMKLIDGFYDWIKEGDDNSPEQYNLDYKNSESWNSKIPVLIYRLFMPPFYLDSP